MLKFLCALGLSIVLWGCPLYMDPPTGVLNILNYTDSAVYVYQTCSESLSYKNGLKLFLNTGGGTDECGNRKKDIIAPNYRINAYSWGEMNVFGTPEKPHIECNDKLRLYFIKEATMRTRTWNDIYKNQLYEKEMTLTEGELNNLCWKVIYEGK